MKKILIFLFVFFLLLGITSCKEETYLSLIIKGYEEINDHKFNFEVEYDEKTLINFDNKVYHKKIGTLLSLLSTDVYTYAKTFINDHNEESIYDCLGMEYKIVQMSPTDYDSNQSDITKYILAKKKIDTEIKTYTILFVVIAGSDGNKDFWKSNLDVGADVDNYYNLTRNHDLWDNPAYHKGFYITAKRVEEAINDFIKEEDENLTILFTGHSRGAAIANILGYEYEKNYEYKTASYTFACPNTINKGDYACETVFNIINERDLIPNIPPTFWNMERFGTDLYYDALTYQYKYYELFHMTYKESNPNSFMDYFKQIASTRESYYSYIEGDSGESYYDYYLIESHEEEGMEELKKQLEEEGLLQYTEVYIKKGTIDYLCIRLTPAFMINFAINIAFSESPLSYFLDRATYLNMDYYGVIKDMYLDLDTDGINCNHIAATYYLIANNIK